MSVSAMAQIKPRLFEFGPKAGLNVSGISNLDTITFDKKLSISFQAGAFARFNVGAFSLQPELIYSVKGATIKEPSNVKYTYKYISAPILLAYTPLKGIYLESGFEFSRALNHKTKVGNAEIYGPTALFDKSWIAGVRFNMLDAFSLFSINLRYTHGLTNAMPNTKFQVTPIDIRNRAVQLSATYTFSEYWRWKKKYGVKKN